METYLESLGTFYNEKIKFLSQKDNLISCNQCENPKEFKETSEELIFTCGNETKNKCGIQIHINLPKYIHYESQLNNLRQKMNNGINWGVIKNYIDIDKGLEEEQDKRNETYKETIKYIE